MALGLFPRAARRERPFLQRADFSTDGVYIDGGKVPREIVISSVRRDFGIAARGLVLRRCRDGLIEGL